MSFTGFRFNYDIVGIFVHVRKLHSIQRCEINVFYQIIVMWNYVVLKLNVTPHIAIYIGLK